MRATTANRQLDVAPGSTTCVVVDVVNTDEVIDGISANVIGLASEFVRTTPQLLPLFPSSGGQLTVDLAVPKSHPAGRHPITVELVSHGAHGPSQYLDVDLDVAAQPGLSLFPSPRVTRARRSGRFMLQVRNTGNVALDVTLAATDVERSTSATFTPSALRVPAGAAAVVVLEVRGPRMFTGGETDRAVQVVATAAPVDLPVEALPDPRVAELAPQIAVVRLRQRPLISRGMLTSLVLLSIIALWAGVFLLGLTKVFSNDPMTKAAPASFFVTSQTGTGAQNAVGGSGGAPAGSLPKSGQLPPGVGGEITGTVVSASDEQPVGRILVQAFRRTTKGMVKVSSSATQSDGTYTLAGLFPTSYYLQFSSTGFKTVWYPAAHSDRGAVAVATRALGSTSGINVVMTGLPATISGTVDAGDTTTTVRTKVTARPLDVVGGSARTIHVMTKPDGSYTLTGLEAPAGYQLTFTTPQYQTSTIVDSVGGGDKRLEPTVTLGASDGGITGIVVNGTHPTDPPIGGATVSTTVDGKPVTVTTPTTGAVGTFVIPNLPTPATYVLSYAAPGHGTWTEVVALSAGQSYTQAIGKLTTGSGGVTGRVVDAHGDGLGGVTVTVGGAAATDPTTGTAVTAPTTTTLTSQPVGTFSLNGLSDGLYTLTFTLDGFAPSSVTVTIDSTKKPPTVRVSLHRELGSIQGVITDSAGHPITGATVTATDGLLTFTATSSVSGGDLAPGGYLIGNLPPGAYAVTAVADGHVQQTRLVHVVAGRTTGNQNLQLAAS